MMEWSILSDKRSEDVRYLIRYHFPIANRRAWTTILVVLALLPRRAAVRLSHSLHLVPLLGAVYIMPAQRNHHPVPPSRDSPISHLPSPESRAPRVPALPRLRSGTAPRPA